MGRIGRSFQLVGLSYRLLMQDRELMVLPLIAGTICVTIAGTTLFGTGLVSSRPPEMDVSVYLPLFLTYVALYAVGIFFQAAVIAGAMERMRGGDPTLRSALSAAASRGGQIVLWAVVAATVGIALHAIEDRLGFVGRIIARIAGAAWALATFFVVPVLVMEGQSVRMALPRSVGMFRSTWGETVVGGVTLGAASVCAWVTLVALSGLLAWAFGPIALVAFAAGAVALMVFFNALQGVYVASLYHYATARRGPAGFDEALLRGAFVPKPRKS